VFSEEMSLQRFLMVEMDAPALIAENSLDSDCLVCRDGRTRRGS